MYGSDKELAVQNDIIVKYANHLPDALALAGYGELEPTVHGAWYADTDDPVISLAPVRSGDHPDLDGIADRLWAEQDTDVSDLGRFDDALIYTHETGSGQYHIMLHHGVDTQLRRTALDTYLAEHNDTQNEARYCGLDSGQFTDPSDR